MRLYRSPIELHKAYGDLPLIQCYPGQLNQVFFNIFNNAIDALNESWQKNGVTPAEDFPWIQVRTVCQEKEKVEIYITNNGPSIPATVQAKMFDPFFTTKAVGQGTGLGLSTSYQIVTHQHQGKLYYQSSQRDESGFVIELPIMLRQSPAVASRASV